MDRVTTTTTLATMTDPAAGAAPGLDLDFWSLIQQGALSTYPLILCSVLVVAIALERAWTLRGVIAQAASLVGLIVPSLTKGDVAGAQGTLGGTPPTPARRIYTDILSEPNRERVELERIADERQFEEAQGAGANLWVLGTIASAAPFIGLFGTVMGIIRSFHTMAIAGTGGFAIVAGGISEALIATALGLAVGIVAVVLYNYFQARVERIDAALQIGSARLIEALEVGRRHHGVR
jgi:biopolymer transport protein ExbB